MSTGATHDMIVAQQGSTFLWTEHYHEKRTLVERVQPLAVATILVVLATGAAEFLSMQMAR